MGRKQFTNQRPENKKDAGALRTPEKSAGKKGMHGMRPSNKQMDDPFPPETGHSIRASDSYRGLMKTLKKRGG